MRRMIAAVALAAVALFIVPIAARADDLPAIAAIPTAAPATPAPYDPHEAIRQANQFMALGTVDCISTAVNVGAGAVERNYIPRLLHVNTSLVNCSAYMLAQAVAIRFTRNTLLRRVSFGYGASGEAYSDLNNIREFFISKKNGATLWHAEPLYMFLRFQWVKLP